MHFTSVYIYKKQEKQLNLAQSSFIIQTANMNTHIYLETVILKQPYENVAAAIAEYLTMIGCHGIVNVNGDFETFTIAIEVPPVFISALEDFLRTHVFVFFKQICDTTWRMFGNGVVVKFPGGQDRKSVV